MLGLSEVFQPDLKSTLILRRSVASRSAHSRPPINVFTDVSHLVFKPHQPNSDRQPHQARDVVDI